MQKKLLGVAGCAALMFGLVACSGEDGTNGVNGLNGADGKDGASCTVKALKKDLGYKILCGGDSVGVILNGEDGEDGASCNVMALKDASKGYKVLCNGDSLGVLLNGAKGEKGATGEDGESCTVASTDDGAKITCGDKSTIVKDGASCSAKETADKAGKKGLEVSCGGTVVGTIWDGDAGVAGANGTSCTASANTAGDGLDVYCDNKLVGTVKNGTNGTSCVSTDNNDGTVSVKCGDADPVTITKAMCGDVAYDPADQFCVLSKVYDKCGGKTYLVSSQYCDNGTVVELCGEYTKLRNGNYKFEKYRAVTNDEFCLAGIITPKCDGKEYSALEFCGTTKNGKKDSIISFEKCPNTGVSIDYIKEQLTNAYTIIGQSDLISSSSVEEEEIEEGADRPRVIRDWITEVVGLPLSSYEGAKVKNFYAALTEVQETCLSATPIVECGTTKYDPEKQFCDIRDNHLYKFETVLVGGDEVTWMTENLAFEYKLPKVITETTTEMVGGVETEVVKRSIDQVMGKVNYEDKVYENFEVNGVRYYTWKSAMGSWDATAGVGDIRRTLDGAALAKLKEEDRVIGVCPDGWRLPTKEEFEALSGLATDPNNENGYETLPKSDNKTVNFNVNFVGLYDVSSNKVKNSDDAAYFWSSSEDDVENQAYGLEITSTTESEVNSTNKTYAFTIRCVKALN